MQNTTCTEDRIQHAVDRCLDRLGHSGGLPQPWNAGWCMNRWSLEELVKRDPENFLILLQQIIRKAKEVQENCQYHLVAPLALMFTSTLQQTPFCPGEGQLLLEAYEVFYGFLTWPEPYCGVSSTLLSTLQQEIRAPGISYHRLVREEQGLTSSKHYAKTITVLLMNPSEVPEEFLAVAEQLSNVQLSRKDVYVSLIKHAFQSSLGTKYPMAAVHRSLQSVSMEELERAFSTVTKLMESAVCMLDPHKARACLVQGLEELREKLGVQASNGRKSDGMLQTIPVPSAKCYMFHWDKDNFDVLNNIPDTEHVLSALRSTSRCRQGDYDGDVDVDVEEGEEEEEMEDEDEMDADTFIMGNGGMGLPDHRASTISTQSSLSTASKDSMFSTLSLASSECCPSSPYINNLHQPSFYSSTSGGGGGGGSGSGGGLSASGTDSDFCEEAEDGDSPTEQRSPASTLPPGFSPGPSPSPSPKPKSKTKPSSLFSLLKSGSRHSLTSLTRAKSLGSDARDKAAGVRSKRSNSLPQQVQQPDMEQLMLAQACASDEALTAPRLRHVCFRRRPILSSDEEESGDGGGEVTQLRVVVFGADHVAGRVARAYSSLRKRESRCPRLCRAYKMRFFFVPVRRDAVSGSASPVAQQHLSVSPLKTAISNLDLSALSSEDSTNDIAQLLGMLDPWYERNTLSLLNLPVSVVCQQTSKIDSESYDDSLEERLPILADLVLYYCRQAARPALIQLYQAELTLAGGEKRREVFIHSLELGHTAGTRAIKAMGAASKRFGIDGDREAVPLNLDVAYNRVFISGRSHSTKADKVCTSINLTKACKSMEELDSKMECLQLTMTEVLKRQNSKSKKGYNQQLTTTRVKVDKVQVIGSGSTTFAVCLDQDEKKILQSVIRCEVSVCYKPDSSADWSRGRMLSSQIQPLHPTFCSLLCLPLSTFSGPQP
ncbi:phosphoinositide 3-kinase regulatory subunit 5 [Engraulis encrasicolus]|uniref:phosphoinositide 3-kinase regulatory subunit 5 n=1 Tax=Engraulis encrasicolus TaxID=184585 RepID=UPI002FD461C0